jgi:hypothetical protein
MIGTPSEPSLSIDREIGRRGTPIGSSTAALTIDQ